MCSNVLCAVLTSVFSPGLKRIKRENSTLTLASNVHDFWLNVSSIKLKKHQNRPRNANSV